jgi:hypothetical protein
MRKIEIGREAAWSLVALGAVAFVWNAGIDVEYWATQAETTRGAFEVAGASVIFQLMVLAFAGIAGYLLFHKSYALGLIASVVLAFFLAYNMMSVMSFQARERIAPARLAEEMHRAQIDAELNAQMIQTERQEQAIQMLRQDAMAAAIALKKAKTKDQRLSAQEAKRAADNAYLEASFATVTAKALPARKTVADPQAEMIATVLGSAGINTPIDQIQIIVSAWWGAGLNLAKVICWFFGFGLMPGRRSRAIDPATKKVIAVDTAPELETRRSPPPLPRPSLAVVKASGSLLTSNTAPIEQVEAFLCEATRSEPGALITATRMYQHYLKWADFNGYSRLNGNVFGRHLTKLGVVRDTDTHTNTYRNVGLVKLEDREAPLTVVA